MNTCLLLRHAALVCENAARGLPVRFADGRPVAAPDESARSAFADRARHFAATAARLDGQGNAVIPFVRPVRCLPGASPTTGNLIAAEDLRHRFEAPAHARPGSRR